MDTQDEIALLKKQNQFLSEQLLDLINSFNVFVYQAEEDNKIFNSKLEQIKKHINLKEFKKIEKKPLELNFHYIRGNSAEKNYLEKWNSL